MKLAVLSSEGVAACGPLRPVNDRFYEDSFVNLLLIKA